MPNTENRNFGERFGEGVRNIGIVGAVIGIIGMIAGLRFGEDLFIAGGVLAITGEVGKRTAGSGKRG